MDCSARDNLCDFSENMKVGEIIALVTPPAVNPPLRSDHTMIYTQVGGADTLILYGGKSLVVVPGYEGDATVGYETRYRFKYSREVYAYSIGARLGFFVVAIFSFILFKRLSI
jgi:hypothetical protein